MPTPSAGFITQPLEQAIAQAQGIDYLSSTSVTGLSTITATLRLNYDANRALTEIQTQVTSVRNQLPPQAQQPVLTVAIGQSLDAMYLGFRSDVLPSNSITDYLARVVKPKLDALQGVQTAEILGGRQFALRAWLDPAQLAAHGVTAADVFQALSSNNYLAAVGTTKGQMVSVDLTAATDLHSVDEFKQLAIKQKDGAIVRLQDVATVVLGAEDYDSNVAFSGTLAVFIGIKAAPEANVLEVAQRVRDHMPEIQSQLPSGLVGDDRLRQHQIHHLLDPRGGEDAGRSAADRHAGDLPVPRQPARGDHPGDRHAAVAGRHLLRHAGARLLDQPADAAGVGAGHRAGGRRCHHRGREHRPPHEGGGQERRSRRRCSRRASSAARSSP